MSWSLAKRGLDLFDEDELTPGSGSLKQVGKRGKRTRISTNRHGIQRAAKQKKRIQQQKKEIRNQLVQKKVTNALKEYEKRIPSDCTEKSIKLLKKLDGKINASHAQKITKHHERSLKDRITKSEWSEREKQKKREVDASATVFTDEDFEKMNDAWLRLNN